MGREMDWGDDSVKSGFSNEADKEKQFKGKKGLAQRIRIVTMPKQLRQHVIHDVLKPDPETGEAQVFEVNCAKTWEPEPTEDDPKAGSWVGECVACDKEYEIRDKKWVAGVLLLSFQKGDRPAQKIDADNSPHWWKFGADKFGLVRELHKAQLQADPPRKITQVECMVTCTDDKMQKLVITKCEGKPLCTADHAAAWKAEGEKLVELAAAPSKNEDLKRRFAQAEKERRQEAGGGAKKGAKAAPAEDELDPEAAADEIDVEAAPKGKAAPAKGKAPARSSADEARELDEILENAAEPAPAPKAAAKAPAKPAAGAKPKPAPKKVVEEEPEATDDDPLGDLG